ncbi:MAG: 4-hydroxy-tetrahydrodipicolinate reductase [Oscillospiraceae bacterium]|jgi:4-hydroxy-tetrahydrodipicolinate reductase|nr:4-hydroxy-tetrahydrodipicolinate reductase [Oscillospiraceae bacterium]
MTNIILSGCNGRMGRMISRICGESDDVTIAAGVDVYAVKLDAYPVFASFPEVDTVADAVVDFSNPSALKSILEFCVTKHIPLVLCTTGYSEEQLADIRAASKSVPIFRSFNMSVGINLLTELIKKAVPVLGKNFDVEIIEQHHRTKIDAPSGTAIMLAEAVKEARGAGEFVYDRHSVRQQRGADEIGISSIRGGTIVGEHSVIFAGPDEVIELKHTAYSREVFAQGAVRAAKYMAGIKEPGMYDMSDII